MRVVDSFVQKKGRETLGNMVRNWKSGALDDKHKYKYRNNGHKLVCTVKGLRLSLRSQESEVFLLEDQTAFDELTKLENKYQKLYVASIVHDIRSPLNGVMGMIEKIDSLTQDPKITSCVDIARKTCQLLLFLTYDITDFSQLEANKLKTNPKKVLVREIFEEVAELLSFSFETKGLACNIMVRDSVPAHILIDKHRYMQILLNLLTNALKFTFKGSVTIEASYDTLSNQLITSVTDTGIGIKPEDVTHLFKLFGKLESSSEINPQGVGFGLAMCKKLSERLGGMISVESAPGRGSTFTFSVNANIGYPKVTALSSMSLNEKCSNVVDLSSKVTEHIFKVNRINIGDEVRDSAACLNNTTGSPFLTSDRCLCSKVLIVDDDPCNLLVLQNYLKLLGLVVDEVSLERLL
eukprot:TRINITY_DN3791_c0_g2_i4.p1 TRINITY_DN3791_c0_g2~~TRINITY_DN3791_c0_g2_i4.p1  ORF type:complete len:408 (+),score=130.12 TRINITY_DN3791_c0_g2_i4:1166-2389(+)